MAIQYDPMKLKIQIHTEPISVLGRFEPMDTLLPPREAWLNGRRCPPGIERIILAGLDVLQNEYLDDIEIEMKVATFGR